MWTPSSSRYRVFPLSQVALLCSLPIGNPYPQRMRKLISITKDNYACSWTSYNGIIQRLLILSGLGVFHSVCFLRLIHVVSCVNVGFCCCSRVSCWFSLLTEPQFGVIMNKVALHILWASVDICTHFSWVHRAE